MESDVEAFIKNLAPAVPGLKKDGDLIPPLGQTTMPTATSMIRCELLFGGKSSNLVNDLFQGFPGTKTA